MTDQAFNSLPISEAQLQNLQDLGYKQMTAIQEHVSESTGTVFPRASKKDPGQEKRYGRMPILRRETADFVQKPPEIASS